MAGDILIYLTTIKKQVHYKHVFFLNVILNSVCNSYISTLYTTHCPWHCCSRSCHLCVGGNRSN